MQTQSMNNITKIREIFTSIQGEGPYVGQRHIFVRFCKCNLKCNFCDTDFKIENSEEYTPYKLYEKIKNINCDVISFTGGEPLLDVAFLKEFLSSYKEKLNKKIYLETNGTLYENLSEIIELVDVVAMDIKIKSATNQANNFELNEKFIISAKDKEKFIKVVFDNKISDDEIKSVSLLAKKYNILLVLQPKMPLNYQIDIDEIYSKFYDYYKNIRLIPQVHKYLNLA